MPEIKIAPTPRVGQRTQPYDLLPEAPPAPIALEKMGYLNEWSRQRSNYNLLWQWFTGLIYDATDEDENYFPIGYNPLRIAANLHRNTLVGEIEDVADPAVKAQMLPFDFAGTTDGIQDSEKERCESVSKLLNYVHYQNNFNALLSSEGMNTQIFGGTFLAARFMMGDPSLYIPIRIEALHPIEVLPIYTRTNPWDLVECYVVRYITAEAAEAHWNVKSQGIYNGRGIYVEHWTRYEYSITIDDEPAQMYTPSGKWVAAEGENPYGRVPIVYIPRDREAGGFYGPPLITQAEGLLDELNARLADAGDSVHDASHLEHYATDMPASVSPEPIMIGDTEVTNLGASSFGSNNSPEIKTIEHPEALATTLSFPNELEKRFRTSVFTPDVAYGEDEGSQRSALTLAFRNLPLAANVRNQRVLWTAGKNALDNIILRIAMAKADSHEVLAQIAVEEKDLGRRLRQLWAPMLPRDQEAEQSLAIAQVQAGTRSVQSAIEVRGDAEDVEAELERIKEDQERKAEMEAATTPLGQSGPNGANASQPSGLQGGSGKVSLN